MSNNKMGAYLEGRQWQWRKGGKEYIGIKIKRRYLHLLVMIMCHKWDNNAVRMD